MGKKKAIILGTVMAIILGGILFLVISSNNYEYTIGRLKSKSPVRFSIIPDSLPEDATGWNKTYLTTILQATGYLRVTIKCTDEYIEQVVDTYEGCAIKAFYGYENEKKDDLVPMIVTDKGMMYESSEYDEKSSYAHPQYKFDYETDDVSNITFYESSDSLTYKNGSIDTDKYDVRLPSFSYARNGSAKEGLIVYIVYDNDNWNHHRIQYVVVDKENCEVTYFGS